MPRFRLDRALSLGVMHPASRLFGGLRQSRIPILMYHGIRRPSGTRHPYFETNTSPALLARHLQFLSSNGYTTVNLSEAVEALRAGREIRKQVVISFDDGYRDFYTQAFPLLAEHGMKATVYIVPGFTAEQRVCRDGQEFMTWGEVREIRSHGIQIGSHTLTHPELYSMGPAAIGEELRVSKHLIEDQLSVPVQSFAYPFAFPEQDRSFVQTLRELLQVNGYRDGVCTIIGTAHRGHDTFFLPRLPVNAYDDLRFLEIKLNGGYDWLHSFQYLRKRMKLVM